MAKYEINVTPEANEFISSYREARGFKSNTEALEAMIGPAVSRLKATMKYAKGHKKTPTPRKPRAPKAPKAKGPLARKQKSAGKGKAKPAPAAPAAPASAPVLD